MRSERKERKERNSVGQWVVILDSVHQVYMNEVGTEGTEIRNSVGQWVILDSVHE